MRLPKFISFTSDYGFKVTFGNEKNTLFLKRALQALIGSPIPITEITFDPTAFEGVGPDSRSGVYDIACTDEMDNHFIVEMQVSHFKNFMQRLKFYGFHKFDTLVERGKHKYENLSKIYCIAILAHNVTTFKNFRNTGCIKNQDGEIMDDQINFITVELPKFDKTETDCKTDLDKLLFTMKALSQVKAPTQYPKFWTEDWIEVAIKELDVRKLSAKDRMAYIMTLSRNAEAVYTAAENIKNAELKVKIDNIIQCFKIGLEFNVIAQINQVSLDFVIEVNEYAEKNGDDFTNFLSIL